MGTISSAISSERAMLAARNILSNIKMMDYYGSSKLFVNVFGDEVVAQKLSTIV